MKYPGNLLVDAHVHYYPCYPRRLFLEAARVSFRVAAADAGVELPWTPVLVLSESRGHRWFRRWRHEAKHEQSVDGWRFLPTGEDNSLQAVRTDAPQEDGPVVVAGRQTVTREGLEVLGIGRDDDVEDGGSLEETVAAVLETGALPVIPWGFGKWWGRRGRRVAELLRGDLGSEVYLGDNAGRPRLAFRPRLFRLADELGVPILPGTDPLPFPRHADRAGSYGFLLPDGPGTDPETPAATLLARLRRRPRPRAWGDRSGLLRFGRDQLAMQIVKRRSGPPPS